MLTFEEVTVTSVEDQIISEEIQIERLKVYDEKIDRVLSILLTEEEREVFDLKVTGRYSFVKVANDLNKTEGKVKWLMKKTEQKLEAFRKFLSLL